uniref:Myb-like domain-containing protein n=1 Tax=Kalanchoe fedtschenkoi TaxID=63787 RepID=A0A7N0U363_KALFE
MGSKNKVKDGAGDEGYADNLLKDNDIDKKEKKKKRKKSAKKDVEGAVDDEVSNHSEQDATVSFAKDDVGEKKLKKKKDNVKSTKLDREGAFDGEVNGHLQEDVTTSVARDEDKKKKKKKDKGDEKTAQLALGGIGNGYQSNLSYVNIETMTEKDSGKEIKMKKKKINSADNHLGGCAGEDDRGGKEKLDETVNGVEGSKKSKKRKKTADATDSSENSKSKGRRVSFSDDVEVFPLPEYLKYRKLNSEGDTIQGKRYTQEEDALILQAVDDYILEHGMAGDGVDRDLDEGWKRARSLIMNCKKNPELKGCWKEIARAIPRRTIRSTYERAHILYERAESRKWSKEELGTIRKFCEEHGPKWRLLGDILGKSRKHVKDAYRRVKMATLKKGAWSQEEYEQLFKLVNNDIIMRATEEKKVKHGMLRDNIAWGAISDKLQTRASPSCSTSGTTRYVPPWCSKASGPAPTTTGWWRPCTTKTHAALRMSSGMLFSSTGPETCATRDGRRWPRTLASIEASPSWSRCRFSMKGSTRISSSP